MRVKKKRAALLLVFCMVFSLFVGIPLNASAEEGEQTGLLIQDDIYWDNDGVPALEENAQTKKATWANVLYGLTLHLSYMESEGATATVVSLENITVTLDEEDVKEKTVKANEKNNEMIDFTFDAVGDYIVTYNNSSITIHVSYPTIGFYTTNIPSVDSMIKDEIQKIDGEDKTVYMILHRGGWEKLDLGSVQYTKDDEENIDAGYFTITGPSKTLSTDPSEYLTEENYVYEIQINEDMKESFSFNVKVDLYRVTAAGEEGDLTYSFTDNPETSRQGINISYKQKKDGLFVVDWLDWGTPKLNDDSSPVLDDEGNAVYEEDGKVAPNPNAMPSKEIWQTISGCSLYLGYAANEIGEDAAMKDLTLAPVTAENITVLYEGTAAKEDKVKYYTNKNWDAEGNEVTNDTITDFEFYRTGTYTIQYTKDDVTSSVTVYVSLPEVGFYSSNTASESTYMRDGNYERGTEKSFYVIPRPENGEDATTYTYKLETEEVPDGAVYVEVDGAALNPEAEYTDTAKITITADARGGFGLKARGVATPAEGEPWEFDYYIYCEDTYETITIEDGVEHKGFAGCFISKDMYDASRMDPSLADTTLYWVHAETMQGVIDKLMETAEAGTVTVNGKSYTIENTGYIWANVSYFPEYKGNATKPLYVTTSDVEGILFASNFEMYYTEEKNDVGSYYEVKLWEKKNGGGEVTDEYVSCLMDDGKYYPVTRTGEEDSTENPLKFNVTTDGEGKTEDELIGEGYVLNEGYGIGCQWPELHVDATTNVKIIGDFSEAAENRANVYLGLYKDSDIVSLIVDGEENEDGNFDFKEITKNDIGKADITTNKGLVVKVNELKATMDATVVGNFISADAVTIEEDGGKALRDKIAIEELFADDEDLKKAIIDGEALDVSMNVKTVESSETESAPVKEGINKISTLIGSGKNKTSKIQYLDIGLQYQVGTKTGDIAETKEDITVSIDLPKDFAKAHADLSKSWTPVVYRYHDGKAEKLDSAFKDGKLKFATGKFSVYAVAIEEVVPTAIKITTPPTKTKYTVGDKFDKKGMVVQVTYSDGTTKNVTDYKVSTTAALKKTDKAITVTYGTCTVKQAITVSEVATKVGDTVTVGGNTYKVTSVKAGKQAVTLTSGSKTAATVTIPATVTIKNVKYKVTAIADKAFYKRTKLTTVKLSANVTAIGKSAFEGCSKLKKVTFNKNLKTLGDKAFYNCKALTQVTLGSKVTTIGKSAFASCTKLAKVTLGTGLTTIGNTAFNKCTALTSVVIPKNVSKIGTQAFYGCKKLKTITIQTSKLTTKNVGNKAFKGIYAKATIKVPAKKLASYKKILKAKGVGSKAKIKK
ncbi:MAG: leucine-rich repeat domain-containing protein [Clostridium sp.]|nr:leucine-rich repeat domain-containing protein [Clostridium sp.]MCM1399094.1 leucine-rich repeat domain-containing protein [Clostridium sp.]MCM1459486.1 leucine-rich repeat domain-containing protein [Bacteroides sp.]